MAQIFSAVAGLLIARWLSVDDYALYTIIITIMGAISVLTKGGAHLGFAAIIGRHWPDMGRVAAAISAVRVARRILSWIVLPPLLVAAGFLFSRQGADIITIIYLTILLILFWITDMQSRVIDQVLFFSKQTTRIQLVDTVLGLGRLGAVLCLFYLHLLSTVSASATGVILAAFRVWPITTWIKELAPTQALALQEDVEEIRAVTIRQLPAELFYVFQSQLVLATLTMFGQPINLAGFGALTRIPQLLLPVQSYCYAFCVPIFSSRQREVAPVLLMLTALCSAPGLVLIAVALIFPSWLLFFIGPNYSSLDHQLLVCATTAAITHSSGIAWNLVAHRGWNKWVWVQIPVGFVWCGLAPIFLDLGSIEGALWFQCGFSGGLIIATLLDLFDAYQRGDL